MEENIAVRASNIGLVTSSFKLPGLGIVHLQHVIILKFHAQNDPKMQEAKYHPAIWGGFVPMAKEASTRLETLCLSSSSLRCLKSDLSS